MARRTRSCWYWPKRTENFQPERNRAFPLRLQHPTILRYSAFPKDNSLLCRWHTLAHTTHCTSALSLPSGGYIHTLPGSLIFTTPPPPFHSEPFVGCSLLLPEKSSPGELPACTPKRGHSHRKHSIHAHTHTHTHAQQRIPFSLFIFLGSLTLRAGLAIDLTTFPVGFSRHTRGFTTKWPI